MIPFLRVSTIAIAALAMVPPASAQTTIIERPGQVQLSPSQRTIIYRHVVRERPARSARVELRVGAPIPPTVELYSLPDEVYVEVPAAQRYRYLYTDDEVVLVDPETSEIVEIIRE